MRTQTCIHTENLLIWHLKSPLKITFREGMVSKFPLYLLCHNSEINEFNIGSKYENMSTLGRGERKENHHHKISILSQNHTNEYEGQSRRAFPQKSHVRAGATKQAE